MLISAILSAQRFSGGLLGGINATQIDGDNWGGYYKMGLTFGAYVSTHFKENWGGQLEIKYSGKGSSTPFKYPEIRMISLRYVDLPVLVNYQVSEKLKIQAGLSFNYLFSAMHYDGEWFEFEEKCRKYETAIALGGSYSITNKLDIAIRYNYSIMPVRSKYSTSSWGEGAWFNNVVGFSLYYFIGQRQ